MADDQTTPPASDNGSSGADTSPAPEPASAASDQLTDQAIDQPLACLPVGLLASAWGRGPDQRIGESPRVQHGLSATGATHHPKASLLRQLMPVLGPVALMAAQG